MTRKTRWRATTLHMKVPTITRHSQEAVTTAYGTEGTLEPIREIHWFESHGAPLVDAGGNAV